MKIVQFIVVFIVSGNFFVDATSQEFKRILQRIIRFREVVEVFEHKHSYQSGLQSMSRIIIAHRNLEQGKTGNISEYDLYRLALDSENDLKKMHKEIAEKLNQEK
ncbi:MAG: hypothetical protein ACXWL5_03835 [Candidatus Chromulinivorax sp.]